MSFGCITYLRLHHRLETPKLFVSRLRVQLHDERISSLGRRVSDSRRMALLGVRWCRQRGRSLYGNLKSQISNFRSQIEGRQTLRNVVGFPRLYPLLRSGFVDAAEFFQECLAIPFAFESCLCFFIQAALAGDIGVLQTLDPAI